MTLGTSTTLEATVGDLLGDPVWTGIAALLAAVAIVLTVVLYRRGRERKELTYRVSTTALVSVHRQAQGRVKITFEDRRVGPIELVEFSLRNTGNTPVLQEDFEHPLKVHLGENATPLTVDVGERHPTDLNPEVTSDGYWLIVEPLLLNPGDTFTVSALVSDFEGPARPEARIAGVSELQDARQGSDRTRRWRRALQREPIRLSVVAAVAGAGAGVAALISAALVENKTHDEIEPYHGATLCGDVLRVSPDRMVLRLKDGGQVRIVQTAEVRAIRKNNC